MSHKTIFLKCCFEMFQRTMYKSLFCEHLFHMVMHNSSNHQLNPEIESFLSASQNLDEPIMVVYSNHHSLITFPGFIMTKRKKQHFVSLVSELKKLNPFQLTQYLRIMLLQSLVLYEHILEIHNTGLKNWYQHLF